MNQPDTIKQRTINVPAGDRTIAVRRMYWKRGRDFLKMLAKHVAANATNLNDAAVLLGRLPEIIESVDELAAFLIVNSTDLNKEAVDELDLGDFFEVLAAAVKLNLGEDLKNSFAVIVETVSRLMPAMKMPSGSGSTST